MRKRCMAFLLAAVFLSAAGIAEAADFKVIVNNGNPDSSISKKDLSRIFLKKSTKWKNGAQAEPVDQVASSPVREAFSREVLGKSVGAIQSYWQRKVFSGRGVPPPEKGSDAEVVEHVRSEAGAVGYVSSGAAVDGVKVLQVE